MKHFTIRDDIDLLRESISITIKHGFGSTSLLQRKMKLNYNRASNLMDKMESMGVLGPPLGTKPRELLIKSLDDIEAIKQP